MRIRKRQVPLPFSSVSPLSDPNFNRPPVTVVQLPLRQQQQQPPPPPLHPHTTTCFDHPNYYPSSESDHPNQPIGQSLSDSSALQGSDGTTTHGEQLIKNTQDHHLALNPGEDEDQKYNDSGKNNVSGAKPGSGSSSSHYQAFPLKKRRGSVETSNDTNVDADTCTKRPLKSMCSKNVKTKVNKKLVCNNEDESKDTNVDGAKKIGRRGGALMEGSRCSRVNGRGWRCCQQTLVGYSLCEHHLGKGRLRSISNVRNRAKEEHRCPISISSSSSKQTKGELNHSDDEEGKEQKPLMMSTKKRVKLGMVKARSMSSLMGQNDNAIAIVDDDN